MTTSNWIIVAVVATLLVLGVALVARRRRISVSEASRGESRGAAPTTAPVAARSTATPAPADVDAGSEERGPTVIASPDVASPDVVSPDVASADGVATDRSLRSRLGKARGVFAAATAAVRGRGGVDDATWDDLEEAMLRADLGVRVITELLEPLRDRAKKRDIADADAAIAALRSAMTDRLAGADRSLHLEGRSGTPDVWLMVGVNGAGKTTTLGKLAAQQTRAGRRVLLAAGDTFRAAAGEQLDVWAQRTGAEIVRGAEGADPASVIFDGIQGATARGVDLVLADTAGRLQSNTNLMEELRKVRRVAEKGSGIVSEVLLVIDATTGQNGLSQARQFADATNVTGVVLTKLDGSAKGGIVFAIETELGIPVKLVGLGETIDDLAAFDPVEFVDALVGN
ncbi:MAG: signal recognition particle-docking protein FtsY [Ilumatobacteraceae bacterium]